MTIIISALMYLMTFGKNPPAPKFMDQNGNIIVVVDDGTGSVTNGGL